MLGGPCGLVYLQAAKAPRDIRYCGFLLRTSGKYDCVIADDKPVSDPAILSSTVINDGMTVHRRQNSNHRSVGVDWHSECCHDVSAQYKYILHNIEAPRKHHS